MENAVGLVMTGGGARGAYQAGVLKRIGELKRARTHGNPFPIIGGASAGAINGAALATGCGEFALATQRLAEAWATLQPSDIFHCGLLSQVQNSLRVEETQWAVGFPWLLSTVSGFVRV